MGNELDLMNVEQEIKLKANDKLIKELEENLNPFIGLEITQDIKNKIFVIVKEFSIKHNMFYEIEHDKNACEALRIYELNAYFRDGRPKPQPINPMRYFAEKYGTTVKEMKKHWDCLNKA